MDDQEFLLELFDLLVFESKVLPQVAYQHLKLVLMDLLDIALLLEAQVVLRQTLVAVLDHGNLLMEALELAIQDVAVADELLVLLDDKLYNNPRNSFVLQLISSTFLKFLSLSFNSLTRS